MEILPSLASLSGLTLLTSVLVVFIKVFDESHKAFFSEMNNQLEDDFELLHASNPAWDDLRQSYDSIKNSDPISLQLVIIASFCILLLLSIGFCIVFLKPDPLSGYGGHFLKGISFMIVVTYTGSAYLFGKMGIQKNKLIHDKVEGRLLITSRERVGRWWENRLVFQKHRKAEFLMAMSSNNNPLILL